VRKNKLIFWCAFAVFSGLTIYALWNEISRDTAKLEHSISGVILTVLGIGSGIVKTDNAHVLLFDPETLELAASRILNPFLPPITFSVGQADANRQLRGSYRMLVLTDKDGNPNRPTVGEIIGPLTESIPLGTEGVEYHLDRPFRSFPEELMYRETDSPETSISGIVKSSPNLSDKVGPEDRLVIMLFDPEKGRPVAVKILENFKLPQKFTIGQSNAFGNNPLEGKFSLRILTDKNNQPFQSVPGEIIGRSKKLISLGVKNLEFVMDQDYIR
jgi:hypothetical protein